MMCQDLLSAIYNTIEGISDERENRFMYFCILKLRAVELLIIEKELAIRGYLLYLNHDKGTVLLQETELRKLCTGYRG